MSESWKDYSNDPDINNFKVLLVYANSPMDNLMPVSISSVSGALRRRGFDVRLFDTTFYPGTTEGGGERFGSLQVAEFNYDEVGIKFITSNVFEDFRNLVQEYNPNLIGLSTVEPTHEFGVALLENVSDLNIPTIVGGVFSILSPEDVIREEVVDMVCIGEGEKTIVELCDRMAKGEDYANIENLWVKHDGKIIKNNKASLINIDELPDLVFSIYDPKRIYRPMAGHLYRMAPIEFSRGCPYQCSYCSAPAFAERFKGQGKWLRNKSINKIIREMKSYVQNYKIEYFYFVSETFLAMPQDRFNEFCKEYLKVGIPFWFNTRPETITENKIKMLEDIGCHRMSIGIECGNEEYRKKMLRRYGSNAQFISKCNIVSKSSIQLSVNNIIGFPDETRSMMFDTINVNREIDANNYTCSIFQPYRGTCLYEYCVNKGYFPRGKLANDLTATSPLKQPHITADAIKGFARVFPLYIKFPKSKFPLIQKAEKFDEEGNRIFDELSKVYRQKYEKKYIPIS